MGLFKKKAVDQGVINRLANILKPILFGQYAVYPESDQLPLLHDSYEKNIDFYAVINRIAKKFAHPPRYVFSKDEEKRSKGRMRRKDLDDLKIDNELSKLLQTPNEYQGQDQFFELVALNFLLSGEVFIWKNRGGIEGRAPLELYILPSQHMTVKPDPTNYFGVSGYQMNMSGLISDIAKEDIIHWKTPNIFHDRAMGLHLRSFSPLIPQKRTIAAANAARDAQTSMFQNGGAKGALVRKDLGDLSREQKEILDEVMKRKINSTDMKAAVAALQGDWNYLDMGLSSVDMQLLEADESLIKKFCNANGLPFELFESATQYANKEQAWMFFITNTLIPMTSSLDSELNRALAPDFGDGIIMTDWSEMPEIQQMRLKAVDAAEKAWWLTPNEKREMMMAEEMTDPTMDKIYIPSTLIPIDEAGVTLNDQSGNTQDYNGNDMAASAGK